MECRGAEKYPAAFVQKTFKELEAAGKADLDTANSAAASGSKDANGTKVADGSKDADGAKAADGSKISARVKKTARVKKIAGAKDVVVKEEENGDGGDDA